MGDSTRLLKERRVSMRKVSETRERILRKKLERGMAVSMRLSLKRMEMGAKRCWGLAKGLRRASLIMREVLRGLQRREEGRDGGRGAFCLLEEGESGGVGGAERIDIVVGPGAFRIYQQACMGAGEAGGQGGRLGKAGERDKKRELCDVGVCLACLWACVESWANDGDSVEERACVCVMCCVHKNNKKEADVV